MFLQTSIFIHRVLERGNAWNCRMLLKALHRFEFGYVNVFAGHDPVNCSSRPEFQAHSVRVKRICGWKTTASV